MKALAEIEANYQDAPETQLFGLVGAFVQLFR